MNSTRMLGTASSRRASSGANAEPSLGTGGVCGSVRQKAASTREHTPETRKVLVSAASMAVPGLQRRQGRAQPRDEPAGLRHRRHLRPVDRDEDERPARGDPADRPPDADPAELVLRVLQVGERDGVRHREGRHVEEAVEQHQPEERPERLHVGQAEHRQPADQVAERQELLLREVAVGELTAEEHPGQRRDGEGVEDPGRLVAGEVQVVPQVQAEQGQPGSPDHVFEEHHHGELGADGGIHRRFTRIAVCRPSRPEEDRKRRRPGGSRLPGGSPWRIGARGIGTDKI